VSLEDIHCPQRALSVFETVVDAIVIDPSQSPDIVTDGLFAASRQFRVPIVLFCAITPASLRPLLRAIAEGPALLVSAQTKKPIAAILEYIANGKESLATHLLSGIAASLEDAPPLLGVSITGLLFGSEFPSVHVLASASAMSRRSLYRWCRKLGLAPPHRLVAAAKILRAYAILRNTSVPVCVAGRAAGYASNKTFLRHCILFTGSGASALRKDTRDTEFTERLAQVFTHCPKVTRTSST
jgi:AraC-like DNA-binding protein